MQLNDAILAKTGGPTVNDGLLAYYRANGALSLDLNDAERQFLVAEGAGVGSLGPQLITDPTITSTFNWNEGLGWSILNAGAGPGAKIDGTNPAKSVLASTTSLGVMSGQYLVSVLIYRHIQGELQLGLGAFRGNFVWPYDGLHEFVSNDLSGISGAPLLEASPNALMEVHLFQLRQITTGANTVFHIEDMWEYYLRVIKGYSGTIDDMKLKFWSAP